MNSARRTRAAAPPPVEPEPVPPVPVVAELLSRLAAAIAAGVPAPHNVNFWPGPEVQVWVRSLDDLYGWGAALALERPHRTRQMPHGRLRIEARGRVAGVDLRVVAFTRAHHPGSLPGDG